MTEDAERNVVRINTDGSVRWSIVADVAETFSGAGSWPVVENTSGERVPVDPATGEEASLDAEQGAAIAFSAGQFSTGVSTDRTVVQAEANRDAVIARFDQTFYVWPRTWFRAAPTS